jgi:chemotaxis protein MotB
MLNIRNFFGLLIILSFTVISCIPARLHEDVKVAKEKCETEITSVRSEIELLRAREKELNVRIDVLEKANKGLSGDTASLGLALTRLKSNYDKLNETYDLLLEKNSQLLRGKDDDNRKLMGQFQLTQEELLKKEERLRDSERDLENKRKDLEQLSADLDNSRKAIELKELKVAELEAILARKDSVVKALREKVTNALLGFQGKGLAISQKNGKVYVSLDESLLFASGSITVDSKGQEAIRNLAKVLEKDKDINVLIEGHTDNVPIKSAAIKDNWDLSVMRATAIVRIITSSSSIDPIRLTAAGKGEFYPIDPANTPEARRKNRRTEIILTPQLDELFKIIEGN